MIDLSAFPKKVKMQNRKNLLIRPLANNDNAKLHRFMKNIPLEHRLFLRDDVADEKTVDEWCENIDYNVVLPLLGEMDKQIVADGTLHFSQLRWTKHVGEIRILVHPDYRGIGIGRAIVHELFSLGIAAGLERMMAVHMSTEDFLIKVLVSLGFMEVARVPRHAKDIKGVKHDLVILVAEVQDVWDQQELMIGEDMYFPLSGQY